MGINTGGREMIKVYTKIGLTLRLFKDSQFEFIRPEIGFEIEVEDEKDIEPQIALAEKAVRASWDKATQLEDELVIAEMPKVNAEMELQVGKKLKMFEKQLADIKKYMKIEEK